MSANSSDVYISFCQPLPENILADFTAIPELDNAQIQNFDANFCNNNGDNKACTKKSHKADREKLRREKINEQFAELAAALDPDRPKNDKASILIESVQVVKELRAEVKRLQDEEASLLGESRELTEEKNELRDEKASLKSETDKLQEQFQQHLRTLSSWVMMDPAVMMSAASFPYPLPVPQAAPMPSSNCQQPFASGQAQRPLVPRSPYVPFATVGAYPVHPVLHTYAAFGNRHGDGSNPYLHFPSYGPTPNGHSHVERPYAQYPSQLHPFPPYVAQMPPRQDSQTTVSSSSPGVCPPCASVAFSSPVQNQTQSKLVSSPNLQTEEVRNHVISSIDVDVAEHRESSTIAVNCSSEAFPNDTNQEIQSSSSSSTTEVTDSKGEGKTVINQGITEQIHEVHSEQGIREADVDKPKQLTML